MARGTRTPGQIYALTIGVVYLAVGVIGFFFADQFTGGSSEDNFIGFRLNHLHNIVHLGLGIAWIGASTLPAAARGVNALLGVVLLLVALLGFTATDLAHTLLNITSATEPDNFLHLVTGALGLVFASLPTRPSDDLRRGGEGPRTSHRARGSRLRPANAPVLGTRASSRHRGSVTAPVLSCTAADPASHAALHC